MHSLRALWYRTIFRAVSGLYYRRIHLVGREHLPRESGPILYVGLHRNGATDGMVYKRLFPRATFLIAARLLSSAFRRLFFTGIPVTREKDGVSAADRSANATALEACARELIAGRELFVLPEGTSDLGPRHLPFKPGVAKILEHAREAGARVTVIPVAIFYERPEAFRSEVTVVVGPPIPTALAAELSERRRVAALMARITSALEALGLNAESAAELSRIETCATLAIDGDPTNRGHCYYAALKALEHAPPPEHAEQAWGRLVGAIVQRKVATAFGVPVYSRRGALWNAGWVAVQSIVVAAALLMNGLPVGAAYLAGRRLADARNTVALWRVLVGAPAAVVWSFALSLACVASGHASAIPVYAMLTAAGVALYPELRSRWAKLRNVWRGSPGRTDVQILRHWVKSLLALPSSALPAGHARGTVSPRDPAISTRRLRQRPVRGDSSSSVMHG
jgi:1-acyl-sn-glycerol-3-phosphate acyltransferase